MNLDRIQIKNYGTGKPATPLTYAYPSRIGFRFSEPDFIRTLDFTQSQNPRLSIAGYGNRKI